MDVLTVSTDRSGVSITGPRRDAGFCADHHGPGGTTTAGGGCVPVLGAGVSAQRAVRVQAERAGDLIWGDRDGELSQAGA